MQLALLTDWQRFLKRSTIQQSVDITRIILLAFTVLLPALILYHFIQVRMETRATIAGLESAISSRINHSDSQENKTTSQRNYSLISSKNIFGKLKKATTPVKPVAVKPVSKAPLTLIGTFISDGQEPFAIIEDPRKKVQEVFNLEDSIFDEAILKKILPDRVEIERSGQFEVLSIDDSPDSPSSPPASSSGGVSAISDTEYTVDEGELDDALANLPLLLTQARAVPYFRDGKSIGLRLFAIKSSSMFQKLGLRNGDILKSINGSSLGDITQAIKLFERLKAERNIELNLERNKKEVNFKYQIR